jgi:hypothetical protein
MAWFKQAVAAGYTHRGLFFGIRATEKPVEFVIITLPLRNASEARHANRPRGQRIA